ncbi:alpha/beta hydrolase [Neolewinella litorea]|uniref:Alpha/beta fold hydrolase n=1 Tax=Neolewinella litorea TaxID=2562452 RepID=A0A4S4NQB0_9BACT|nr:alpha/beta fold hydrolase [Neolewinella litorea]THH41315.1 alpha/beta fold hydrolase [Neolewinella litorea]
MKKVLVALAALLLVYLVITYLISERVLDTPNRSLEESYRIGTERWGLNLDSLRAALPPPEEVNITSPVGGLTQRGWLYRQDSSRCGIIMAHGYNDNRMSMIKYTPYFDRCGCDLLLYDHRGFGESDEAYASGGVNEAKDLLAAHAWFGAETGLPGDRIAWLGESWGAATVLLAAAEGTTNLAFVVAESPFADWHSAITERGVREYGPILSVLSPGTFQWVNFRGGVPYASASPVEAADKIAVPVLLFHSRADTLTAPEQSDRIAERIRSDLLTYHALEWGAWHAHNVVWRPQAYVALLENFVQQKAPGFCP